MRLSILMALLFLCGIAIAQDKDRPAEREDLRKERFERMEAIKIAYITKELSLTPEESKDFWPVYNKHHEKLKALRDSSRPKKGELTEEEANTLIDNFIASEYERAKIHEEMTNDLKLIIGSVRVVTLVKVEHKFKREILSKADNKRKHKSKGNRRK